MAAQQSGYMRVNWLAQTRRGRARRREVTPEEEQTDAVTAELRFDNVVTAPTLLVVGGRDDVVIELNERAFARPTSSKSLARWSRSRD
jgi:hypothetical protein